MIGKILDFFILPLMKIKPVRNLWFKLFHFFTGDPCIADSANDIQMKNEALNQLFGLLMETVALPVSDRSRKPDLQRHIKRIVQASKALMPNNKQAMEFHFAFQSYLDKTPTDAEFTEIKFVVFETSIGMKKELLRMQNKNRAKLAELESRQ